MVSTLGLFLLLTSQSIGIELNMYYPVAVGGPLTKIVDGMEMSAKERILMLK